VPATPNRSSGNGLRLTLIGAPGRMGRALTQAVANLPDLRISGAVATPSHPDLGRDIGELNGGATLGVRLTSDLKQALASCDVALEFARSTATAADLLACRAALKPLVVGTSGLPTDIQRHFEAAAREIPVLVATNASLGATLLFEIVREATARVPRNFDAEIIEIHDRLKEDAPSGTAHALGRVIAQVRGQNFQEVAVLGSRAGRRRDGDIGFAVVRGGDTVDEHTVLFAGPGEHLVLGHRAFDYGIFVQGALTAARWLARKPAGLYRMRDVLGHMTPSSS
jgi:4-hydroxy-tetrahydrodipicolinate reductase